MAGNERLISLAHQNPLLHLKRQSSVSETIPAKLELDIGYCGMGAKIQFPHSRQHPPNPFRISELNEVPLA
jgi:hypothetical protein